MADETPEEQKKREAAEAAAEAKRKETLRLAEEAMHQRKGTGFPY